MPRKQPFLDDGSQFGLRTSVAELRVEFGKEKPQISLVKRWAAPLRDAIIASTKWAANKLDIVIDETAKAVGKAIGSTLGALAAAYVASQFVPPIHQAFDAIISWLDVAARTLF